VLIGFLRAVIVISSARVVAFLSAGRIAPAYG
jgi:hypothetical protein